MGGPTPHPPLAQVCDLYLQLCKSRLTMLIVITALGGYAMAPAAGTWITLG